MRFLAGLYLMVFGFIWTWQLSPNSLGAKIFMSSEIAFAFGLLSFALGAFCVSPRFWAWREVDAQEESAWANINQLLRGTWYGVGGLMGLMGVGMLACAMLFLKEIGAAASFLFVLTGLVYAVGGGSLLYSPMSYMNKHAKQGPKLDGTNLVLRVAKRHQGRVTPAEVAADSNLELRQCAKILAQLASDGFCEERITQQGTSFYYFPEFASALAKRDFLDDDEHGAALDHGVVFGHDGQAQRGQDASVAAPQQQSQRSQR